MPGGRGQNHARLTREACVCKITIALLGHPRGRREWHKDLIAGTLVLVLAGLMASSATARVSGTFVIKSQIPLARIRVLNAWGFFPANGRIVVPQRRKIAMQ